MDQAEDTLRASGMQPDRVHLDGAYKQGWDQARDQQVCSTERSQ